MDKKKDSSQADFDCALSGFSGYPLEQYATGMKSEITEKLVEIGITDAEQFLGVAGNPTVIDHLEEFLGVSRQVLDDAVIIARKALPETVSSKVEQPVLNPYALGVLPPTQAMLAAAEKLSEPSNSLIALPSNINLINRMPPIRFQASRGTCVAFTVSAIHDYATRIGSGEANDFSEQHIYYETKLIDGEPDTCGTWQEKAAIALETRGQCLESIWPYDPNPPCNNHGNIPPTARANGLNYRLQLFAIPVRDVQAIKAALVEKKPVGISIPLYNSWYQSSETKRSGRLNMRIGTEPNVGGHAVCLVGYQDSPSFPGGGYFILRNSWSTSWGYECPYGAGYGTIPYQYISNDNWEAFAPLTVNLQEKEPIEGVIQSDNSGKTTTIRVKGNVNLIIE